MKDERVEEIRQEWALENVMHVRCRQHILYLLNKLDEANTQLANQDSVLEVCKKAIHSKHNELEAANQQIDDQISIIEKLEAIADAAVEVANEVGINTYPELIKALIAAGKIEGGKDGRG